MPDLKPNALMPKGEANGLTPIAPDLIKDPKRFRAVIAVVDCKRVTHDQDTGDDLATVRLRRAEVVLVEDLPAAEQLMRRALEFRTGLVQLPLELEDEIERTFREMTAVDPDDSPDTEADPPAEA
jgi:hypothetical protein